MLKYGKSKANACLEVPYLKLNIKISNQKLLIINNLCTCRKLV